MTLHQFHLVGFGAACVIHGTQAVLVWKLWRRTMGANQDEVREGIALCALTFFFQFGNLWRELGITYHYPDESAVIMLGYFIEDVALLSFPLLFSYMCRSIRTDSQFVLVLTRIGSLLRFPLWVLVPVGVAFVAVHCLGRRPVVDIDMIVSITLNIMLYYFIVFFVAALTYRNRVRAHNRPMARANKASLVASLLAVGTFIVMLWSPFRTEYFGWIQWASMMTTVPFSIAVAYRLYQFPFMDSFLRDVLTGTTLLVGFCVAYTIGFSSPDMQALWMVIVGLGLAFMKAPVSRWVDKTFLGYTESVEEQEERIGNLVRQLSGLDEFEARVAEIVSREIGADWVSIRRESRPDAVEQFQIPGTTRTWLALGPRKGARSYMSRQLQLARRIALELSVQRERLEREETNRRQLVHEHELRETTARAQMRALQAQINPHFLFNTPNVLANLIHRDPAKAEHVTEDLAEIFRYALESTRVEWVRLEDELNFLKSYLEIERTRFEDRLNYEFDVGSDVRTMRIPPMILQPLVENAVRHGISPLIDGGRVRIVARAEQDGLKICVEDTGAGLNQKGRGGTGIGLSNVRERLAHIYGGGVVFQLEENSPQGTRVVLVLPQHREVHA